MDFPSDQTPTPLLINCYSRYSFGMQSRVAHGISGGSSNGTWVANQAVYIPFSLPWHYIVRRLYWLNGSTVGGTCTVGLYTEDGANIYRSAAITTAGSSALQYVAPAAPLLLVPGLVYFGIAFSGTANVFAGITAMTAQAGRSLGLFQESAIPAVDSPATFAQWNSTFVPVCGITQTASGF